MERDTRMEKNLIRLLKANEIECRIAVIKESGLSLLLYKDARVDQRILDETFGAFGWKRSHQCSDGAGTDVENESGRRTRSKAMDWKADSCGSRYSASFGISMGKRSYRS